MWTPPPPVRALAVLGTGPPKRSSFARLCGPPAIFLTVSSSVPVNNARGSLEGPLLEPERTVAPVGQPHASVGKGKFLAQVSARCERFFSDVAHHDTAA